MKKTKQLKEVECAENLVMAIQNGDDKTAKQALEDVLRMKCERKIKQTLHQ